MKQNQKTLAFWLVLVLGLALLFKAINQPKVEGESIPFSQVVQMAKNGEVLSLTYKGNDKIVGKRKVPGQDGAAEFTSEGPKGDYPTKLFIENGVELNYEQEEGTSFWQQLFISWFPMLLLFVIFIFFMRQIQAGGGKAMSFGKSKAKLLHESQQKFLFKDVAGADEAKEELQEIVEFLKDPKKFTKLGGRLPKGVLLIGPPGTGKTLLAKAIAGEAGVPFFSISGSDFVEMFVGVGASRVRDLFEQGKKNAPCIIFMDEIDAVGRHRGAGLGGGHDEREQTLNQLLVEMDGFETSQGVILIAATNRPDVLDPALLRPGRFDRRVTVPRPDVKGREQILKVHTDKTPIAGDVDLAVMARGTPGMSGADLANLVNEAALWAARRGKKYIEMDDFEMAKDKILMGSERRSMVLTEDEKRVTAYHEAGHTLVGKLIPGLDPVHKVTIVPRGQALGVTQTLPEDNQLNLSVDKAESMISFLMGGRIAEKLVFEHVTTGAGNDIERASDLARKMVCEWGMSKKLGPITFGEGEHQPFLGMEANRNRNYSESTAREIDEEVREIIDTNYKKAEKLLKENLDTLKRLAEALLDRESLSSSEVDAIMKGQSLDPVDGGSGSSTKESSEKSEKGSEKTSGKDEGVEGSEPFGSDPVTV
jgi:cell division protease FtsH